MDSFAEMMPLTVMMVIPMIAIIGGITHGIIKSIHRQRLQELAHKERIAAIERGINPQDLPPTVSNMAFAEQANGHNTEHRQLIRSQRFMMWGLIVIGIGITVAFAVAADSTADNGAAFAGVGIAMVGVALLICARIVRPDREDLRREKDLRERLLLKSIGELPDNDRSR